ncbi:MAG: type I-U CRISPR-associated protein Csb2 [Candidatus Binataceae bacterium]|jgi:CRISPR-associated protein Csb2
MALRLCISIRFLAPAFHGSRDADKPEWPPSPMRVFQSLVAAAAARWRAESFTQRIRSAFEWLEKQAAPMLITPTSVSSFGYRLSVPNNAMDIVAKAWCRGNYSNSGDANPATHRTMKAVRPTLLLDGAAVHYLWPLHDPIGEGVSGHVEALQEIARSVVALGWGVDMAVGHATVLSDDQVSALSGERWLPYSTSVADGLRAPVPGTLNDLIHRHKHFLARLGPDGLSPPPPLSTFRIVEYKPASRPRLRAVAAFSLLKLDASGFRGFDTVRRGLTVVGMMRHATKTAAAGAGWSESDINTLILGHGESPNSGDHVPTGPRRFAYLPLPSIEARREGAARVVGSIRRIILSSFTEEFAAQVGWARRTLSGQELIDEDKKQPVALLSLLPATDKVVQRYTQSAASWATVTPVVLPGYDDPDHYRRRLKSKVGADEQKKLLNRMDDRIDGLLRKAIVQAGFSQTLADHAELEWRNVGFWPGADLVSRYGVPEHLRRFPRFHVRLQWRDARNRLTRIPGPICLGGGRFYGLGLFAAL